MIDSDEKKNIEKEKKRILISKLSNKKLRSRFRPTKKKN